VLGVEVLFLGVIHMVKGFKFYQSLCSFVAGVVCPHKNTAERLKRFSIAKHCVGLKCEHFVRFEREMDDEDERLMDGFDRLHELHARWDRGEISEEEFREQYLMIDKEMSGGSG